MLIAFYSLIKTDVSLINNNAFYILAALKKKGFGTNCRNTFFGLS